MKIYLGNGTWREATQQEIDDYQDDYAYVPRKVVKALLAALVAKNVFTAQEVATFIANNRVNS